MLLRTFSRKTLAASCTALFLFSAGVTTAQAAELSKERPLPVSFSSLPVEQAQFATKLFETHHRRVMSLEKRGELSRERFDAIFADFIAALEPVLVSSRPTDKSGSDCTTACSLAQTATDDICDAADQAAIAKAACPSSVYADDADYYSDTECQSSTVFTVPYSCMGPSGKTQALAWLATAKTRSYKAWSNAWYAYSTDGCSESYQTSLDASDSYVNFHNARYYMSSCS